ncbi:MAG TPA: glycogen synthase GlgA [Bacteroidota bacterium]|nr:glycogen synthase GlgA [Bacteroidota bacterium]
MAKPLNVLFLSSEVEPFAKTGGLADVSGALPQTIKSLDHEIRIMMPRYGGINERKLKLHDMIRLKDIPVPIGSKSVLASVKSSFLNTNNTKVQVYFLDNHFLFGRSGLYVHPDTKKDYPDNDDRFIFFARGVLETLKRMGWQPDIIHCNDWQTGLVPAFLKTLYKDDPFYKDTKTVFTIHNMAYQGVFPKSSFPKTGLPKELFSEKGVEAWGNLNMLKSGLVFSDAITTVSEKYAEEIRSSDEYGCGLQDILARRKSDLCGIINGIDYNVWNPALDELIPHRYDFKTIDLKQENKQALLNKMDLPTIPGMPLIGIISRLADQKGFDLIGEILDDMMKLNLQIVVLGTGEKRYHDLFERAAAKFPDHIAVHLSFNNDLAHLIEAGSDMFLMPSRYEPCGLNQLYSLKYGTVPIVRATGGLDDSIENFSPANGNGTGFKFTKYQSSELLKTIQRAVQIYSDQTIWRKIIRNGMSKDFSWEASAKKYLQLYRGVTRK